MVLLLVAMLLHQEKIIVDRAGLSSTTVMSVDTIILLIVGTLARQVRVSICGLDEPSRKNLVFETPKSSAF